MLDGLEEKAKGALETETAQLARLIYDHSPHDGTFSQRIPGLYFNRYSRMDTEWIRAIHSPFVGIAAQGEKTIAVRNAVYRYGGSRIFVAPVVLPVTMQTTHANYSEPFLGIGLTLDPQLIAEWVLKVYPQGLPTVRRRTPGYVVNADWGILHAVTRLAECLSEPGDVQLLAPLVMDEIVIRLLRSAIGRQVAEMGMADSRAQRVAQAIAWLQNNYSQPIHVADLAGLVHMSVSSFIEHFKSVTSMSPLQYQKTLRLHKARSLMLSHPMDATEASMAVGYVSAAQFSRDYRRLFGNPPIRDITKLRGQVHTFQP